MRSMFAVSLIVMVALSGCAESGDTHPEMETPAHVHGEHDHNATMTPAPAAVFTADLVNGTAPLLVNFTIDAMNATDGLNATWSIAFGDGNATNGTGLPAVANYTFGPGNFTSVLNLTVDGVALNATLTTVVLAGVVAEPARALPEVTHFEFGDSLGCAGDFLQIAGLNCVSFLEGPDASGIDGYWLALDETYWGLAISSTVDNGLGDSDCFFTDDAFATLGSANNGGDPCGAAKVPDGTAWLFIYSYAEPALAMTADFAFA